VYEPESPSSTGVRGAAEEAFEEGLRGLAGLTVRVHEPLSRYTTFRIGGPAHWLIDVASSRALAGLLRLAARTSVPVHPLGLGSNVLFPDEGLAAAVVRLTGEFKKVRWRGRWVSAGAGLALPLLARRTAQRDLLGLEALSGFPSTVGGAVYMNAGCYGTEIRDVLVAAVVLDGDGRRRRWRTAELEPGYRSTRLQRDGGFVTRALFRLTGGDGRDALARIDEWNAKRWASLPSGVPNAGSIFKNPAGDHAGRLIEQCGLKGHRVGGAQISPKHANVIVNVGGARATEVLDLMLEARRRVLDASGVGLVPEIVLTGSLRERWTLAVEGGRPA
jgi:UDP-N-acetylmuramate dehydrogenase